MKKVQKLEFDLQYGSEKQQPIYCPLTGKILITSDPFEELSEFPQNVLAVFVSEYMESPHYLREDMNQSDFSDLENIDELESILENQNHSKTAFLLLKAMNYGIHSGDSGGWIFVLEIANAKIG